MENIRIKSLLKTLLMEDQAVTIGVLAKKLGVSSSTIRNDLNIIEHILLLNGCILVKNQGIGVYINGSAKQKQELLNKLQTNKDKDIQMHSQEYRICYILQSLLINTNSYIKVDDLSEELFVSRSTIQKDLLKCEKWLNDFHCNLEIKRKTGFRVSGSEIDYRKALEKLIYIKSKNSKLKSSNKPDKRRLSKEISEEIKDVFNIDYSLIEKVISDVEKKLCLSFNDESYTSLVIHITISIKRILDKNEIIGDVNIEDPKENREYAAAVMIKKEIEDYYNIFLNQYEIYYLFLNIASAKHMKNPIKKLDIELDNRDELCINIAKEIISMAERVYNQNFKEDEEFYKGLLIHLRPTINRLLFSLTFSNPLLQEIKGTYPRAYGIAYMCSEIFEKYLGKPIPEEEIGYIAIHIQAAAERKLNTLNTVVVCSTGMGTAELLATKIQKRFNQINIISVESYSDFSSSDKEGVDLVLSTIPIKTKIPHLVVSPLLTVNDVNSIYNFIEKGHTYENQLRNFIDNSLVYNFNNCKNKEEIIHNVYMKCKNQGYVTDEYYNGVIKREKSYSTEIGKGVAVPHSPLEFVKKSVMVLVKLDKPIRWDTTMVDIVLFIAISKSDSYQLTDLLKNIYSCLDYDAFLDELRAEKDSEKIKDILYEKCIEI